MLPDRTGAERRQRQTDARPPRLTTRAPAKVNLTLHVLGRRPDGYHALESLVVFAGAHDLVSLDPTRPPSLTVTGPFAEACGAAEDNLVLRAAAALATAMPGLRMGAFHLVKRLPAAAGLGGGSADAAAALRLLARLNGLTLDDPAVQHAARATGADVTVCLRSRAAIMAGAGEEVRPHPQPRRFAVLVNPGVPVETRAVFARLGLPPGASIPAHGPPADPERGRNDLEPHAIAIAPVIAEVLARLRRTPGCRLARMSGSGATCFGLYDAREGATRAVAALRSSGWWVKATSLA